MTNEELHKIIDKNQKNLDQLHKDIKKLNYIHARNVTIAFVIGVIVAFSLLHWFL
jgi:hypothetical protein